MTAVVYSFLFIHCLIHSLSKTIPKCSKNGLRRRPKITLKAKNPSKCPPKKLFCNPLIIFLLLRAWDRSCRDTNSFKHLRYSRTPLNMSVKCFSVKKCSKFDPKMDPKRTPRGTPKSTKMASVSELCFRSFPEGPRKPKTF